MTSAQPQLWTLKVMFFNATLDVEKSDNEEEGLSECRPRATVEWEAPETGSRLGLVKEHSHPRNEGPSRISKSLHSTICRVSPKHPLSNENVYGSYLALVYHCILGAESLSFSFIYV